MDITVCVLQASAVYIWNITSDANHLSRGWVYLTAAYIVHQYQYIRIVLSFQFMD